MSATLLPDGVLRVPTSVVLPGGACVDGTRDLRPGDPHYDEWLRVAHPEAADWSGDPEDEAILRRWHTAKSA